MTRTLVRAALALLCLSAIAAATAVAAPRLHRTTLPPPVALPRSLAVDEGEWLVRPSRNVVAAGDVTFRVYNRGMDDHDFSVVDAAGTLRQVPLAPGADATLTVTLGPGRHRLYCSLFAGTPESHEALGMVGYIDATADPAAAAASRRTTSVRERRR